MTHRLPKGVDRLPSGTYRARMSIQGESYQALGETADGAVVALREVVRLVLDQTMIPAHGASIAQLGPRFLASRSGNRSVRDDVNRWHTHIVRAPFATMAPDAITRVDVLEWLDDLKRTDAIRRGVGGKITSLGHGLKWQTRKHLRNLLCAFFVWAIDREKATANPCDGVKVKREDGDEDDGYQEGWYIGPEEQPKFFELCHEHGGEEGVDMAWFAVGTGLRLNELNTLHDSDVDVGSDPHIKVRFGSWDPDKQRFRSPKGKAGTKYVRRVDLFGPSLEAAKRQKLRRLEDHADRVDAAKKAKRKAPELSPLFWPSKQGGRRTKSPHWLKKVSEALPIARLGRPIWWHLLRHTCASSLVAGWWGHRWSLLDVSKHLRHSSIKVTERYAHLAESVGTEVATRAHAAWAKSCHTAVTTTRSGPNESKTAGLLSRGSQVRILPGAPKKTRGSANGSPSHDKAVTTAIAVLEAVAEGRPVERHAVVLAEWVLENVASSKAGKGGVGQ